MISARLIILTFAVYRAGACTARGNGQKRSNVIKHVFTLLLLLCILMGTTAWANGHGPWPPAPVYELHQKEIPKGDDVEAGRYQKHIEYSLTFEDHTEPVFLARAYTGGKSGYSRLGFSEDTFKLSWLGHGTLLHASWETAIQGSGRHVMDSDVLFLKSNGAWREIFRDTHFGYDRNGWHGSTFRTLSFGYNAASDTLLISSTYSSIESWEGEWYPLAKQTGVGIEEHNKDVPLYGKTYKFIRAWACKLVDGEIQWRKGILHLELDSIFKATEVVDFLQSTEYIHDIRTATDTGFSERIQKLNPRFGDSGACWDKVLLDRELLPYESDGGHYYWRNPT